MIAGRLFIYQGSSEMFYQADGDNFCPPAFDVFKARIRAMRAG